MRGLRPERLALIKRYCKPWHETWAPSVEWSEAITPSNVTVEYAQPASIHKRNALALAEADDREAEALRRARAFQPALPSPTP